jgi:Mg/Co/Ni transporter MgtE
MDVRIVSSLIGAILFLIMASAPVFAFVRDLGVKDKDMSLVVRSTMVGVLTFASMTMLL